MSKVSSDKIYLIPRDHKTMVTRKTTWNTSCHNQAKRIRAKIDKMLCKSKIKTQWAVKICYQSVQPPWTLRSSCPKVFYEKGAVKNFAKSTRKQLSRSLFFRKVPCYFLNKEILVSSLNFTKFFREPLLQNTPGRLLLEL